MAGAPRYPALDPFWGGWLSVKKVLRLAEGL